jgi:hypothetical protein
MWPELQRDRPFAASLTKIGQLDAKKSDEAQVEQLGDLSKLVVKYRSWIEELEAKEDEFRSQDEQKKQQGLASARNELRELQKRQDDIANRLDRSAEKSKDDLEKNWPTTRIAQNTNLEGTRRLENQLRVMSPAAGNRMKAAVEAMEIAMKTGDNEDFVQAESAVDMAGRLLRQADQAAQRSQQKRQDRGRRRRIAGDSYHGQQIVSGDVEIKREYEVDRRYREDILDEVSRSNVDEENRILLDNYLRRVIR